MNTVHPKALGKLHEQLTANREDLIDRCKVKVALRQHPSGIAQGMEHGIPLFLDQLIKTLRLEGTRDPISSQEVSGPSGGEEPVLSEMGITAMQHGADLLRQGFTVDQVVHDYGDLCQAITEMAFDKGMAIEVNEFRTLNRCLDNAIAGAVTEFSCRRVSAVTEKQTKDQNQRLGILAHEMRNLLYSASLALAALKSGGVGLNGATGAVLDRSLVGLSHLIDRSLAEVRMTAAMPPTRHTFSLGDFIEDIRLTAALEARLKECRLVVEVKNPKLPLNADREMLMAAVGNLLQNAFKFTRRNTEVTLAAHATQHRILISIRDHCGGLPSGAAERMFQPFTQSSEDRSGLGLGLSISRRSVEANQGTLSVQDVPGTGCVFTIDLPRHPDPAFDAWSPPSTGQVG